MRCGLGFAVGCWDLRGFKGFVGTAVRVLGICGFSSAIPRIPRLLLEKACWKSRPRHVNPG